MMLADVGMETVMGSVPGMVLLVLLVLLVLPCPSSGEVIRFMVSSSTGVKKHRQAKSC